MWHSGTISAIASVSWDSVPFCLCRDSSVVAASPPETVGDPGGFCPYYESNAGNDFECNTNSRGYGLYTARFGSAGAMDGGNRSGLFHLRATGWRRWWARIITLLDK